MPRRAEIVKREILPDPKYDSKLIARFINVLMSRGKKSLARKILYGSMSIIEKRVNQDGLTVFSQAINNVKPIIEIRPRRVGGQVYQIPVDVKAERRTTLALRWIIQAARGRGEKTMAEQLAGELLDAAKNEGAAIRKKIDQHRMAEANRAFAHYRW